MSAPKVTGYPGGEFTLTLNPDMPVDVALNHAVNQLRNAGAPAALMGHFSFRLGYWSAGLPEGARVAGPVEQAARDCLIGVIWT